MSLPACRLLLDGQVATAEDIHNMIFHRLAPLLYESLIKLPQIFPLLLQSSLSGTPSPLSSPSHTPVVHDGSPRAEIDPMYTQHYLLSHLVYRIFEPA